MNLTTAEINAGARALRTLLLNAGIPECRSRAANGSGTRKPGFSVQWHSQLGGWLVIWKFDTPANRVARQAELEKRLLEAPGGYLVSATAAGFLVRPGQQS